MKKITESLNTSLSNDDELLIKDTFDSFTTSYVYKETLVRFSTNVAMVYISIKNSKQSRGGTPGISKTFIFNSDHVELIKDLCYAIETLNEMGFDCVINTISPNCTQIVILVQKV